MRLCASDGALMASLIRYFPPEEAPEWHEGAASMANDPRDPKRYNSRLEFRKRQGVNKALCDLAPMRAILLATRTIRCDEEIFYNYGSDKPFEKMRKEAQREELESAIRNKEVCHVRWVPCRACLCSPRRPFPTGVPRPMGAMGTGGGPSGLTWFRLPNVAAFGW